MTNEIIRELWGVKDKMADEYGWDVRALVAHLRTKKHVGNQHVVDLRTMKPIAEQVAQADRSQQGTL